MNKEDLPKDEIAESKQVDEPITCVMEALLLPAEASDEITPGSYKATLKGDVEGSIGRGVILLYLNSEKDRQMFKTYPRARRAQNISFDLGALKLTATEKCVLDKLSEGKSNKAIADDLFVSINTVKTHIRSIFQKLNVNCRSAAVRKALDFGIVGCS